MQTVTVDLLRHGKVEGPPDYFRGHTDAPLSELGWRQMRFACPAEQTWQAIYTSPLKRCHSFATELATSSGTTPIIDADLAAAHYGQWENRSSQEIHAEAPEIWKAYQADPFGFRPPGGESVVDVAGRARLALLRILAEHPQGSLLLVTHSTVILGIIARVTAMPQSHWDTLQVGHASFSRIRFTQSPSGWHGKIVMHLGSSPLR
jgi:broad specificity phosphatase PhoE